MAARRVGSRHEEHRSATKRLAVATLAVVLTGAVASASAQTPGEWEPINPGGGGWFERIGVGHGGLLLAASDLSGVYRSIDAGATWEALGPARGLMATHVVAFGFHPTNGQVFFVGTDDGIYRTLNGGASFDHPQTTGYFGPIVLAPSDPLIGYAGWHTDFNLADGEIYTTTDGGATWSLVNSNLPPNLRVLKLLVERNFPNHVYLLSGPGRCDPDPGIPPQCGDYRLLRSLDGGVTWTDIGVDFSQPVVDLALDPFAPATVWASVDDATLGNRGHLFKSTNRGNSSTWNEVGNFGGFIWLDPTDAQHIRMFDSRYQFAFPGEDRDGFFETTNGGAGWSQINEVETGNWGRGWSGLFWTLTAETYQVAAHPTDPDKLYWANSQFLYGTTDGGQSVAQVFTNEVGAGSDNWRSRGVDNVVIIELEVDRGSPNTVWAGFIDLGLWRSQDGGSSWTECNLPAHTGDWEGYGGNTWTIVADPQRAGTVWAVNSAEEELPAVLLRTTNAGGPDCDDWTVVGSGLPAAPYLGLSIDDTTLGVGQMRTLYLTADGDVWKSLDDGSTWVRSLVDGGMITTLIDPFDPQIVYAGGASGLLRSDNGGASWVADGVPAMAGGAAGLPFGGWEGVYDIAADAANVGRFYVAAHGSGKGLWVTDDDGASWMRLLADDFMRSVVVNPSDSGNLFVTSSSTFDNGAYDPASTGVWSIHRTGVACGAAGSNCERIDAGLVWPFGLPIDITADGATLYIGSPGTGIHRRGIGRLFADGFESGDTSAWTLAIP